MAPLRSRNKAFTFPFVAALSITLTACGADTGSTLAVDAAADAGPDSRITLLDGRLDFDTSTMTLTDGMAEDAQPTVTLDATAAFTEIAGTYTAKAANVSGSAANLFDNGASYTFTIGANGTATFNTKGVAETFTWAMHSKRIVRNPKNKITVIEMEDAGKRIITITYHPSNGPFDIAGVIVEPQGRWYLTGIVKQ